MSKTNKSQKERSRDWQKKRTLIYVFPETKEKLKDFGKIGDTFDDAISNLVAFAKVNREKYNDFIHADNT